MTPAENRRILLVDDPASPGEDIREILLSEKAKAFEIDAARRGEEGLAMLSAAIDEGRPYAMAFVERCMPTGWDGITTIRKLSEKDPKLQVVICTAFSDCTWEELVQQLGRSDRLLILKKPFDKGEIRQLTSTLIEKWNAAAREERLVEDLKRSEQEARSYASSLETMNRALVTSKAASDMAAEHRMAFLLHFSEEASGKLGEILSGVGRLRDSGEISGMNTRSLDLVLDASHRLRHTVAEILDVTELELGRARVDEELCSPIQLAADVLDELRDSAQSRGVELALEEATSVPETVCSEPTRIRQILRSLLKNAIQSIDSGSGSVTVTVSTAQPASWKRPQLRYEVTDTGVGIPKQRMGTLFEPFAREDELREQSGCGFGLALARRLAILLGGDLAARSEPGQGSSFTLTLNVGPVAARRKAA